MKQYHIPVFWIMTDEAEVYAENLEDAIEKVKDDNYENDLKGEYVDNSFEVNIDCIEDLYPNEEIT